ncbi:MAG TPA: hypothetical protein VF032_11725, partial [Thermoleophilaceae bacterium]
MLADLNAALLTSAEFSDNHQNAVPCVDDVLHLEPVFRPPADPVSNPFFDAAGAVVDPALGSGGGNVELDLGVIGKERSPNIA